MRQLIEFLTSINGFYIKEVVLKHKHNHQTNSIYNISYHIAYDHLYCICETVLVEKWLKFPSWKFLHCILLLCFLCYNIPDWAHERCDCVLHSTRCITAENTIMCILSQDYNWELVLYVEKCEMESQLVYACGGKWAVDETHRHKGRSMDLSLPKSGYACLPTKISEIRSWLQSNL